MLLFSGIIRELSKIRDDIHWTIFSPTHIDSLSLKNTEQLIPLPFTKLSDDTLTKKQLYRILILEKTILILFILIWEHTLQLKNVLLNETNIEPRFIGYTHWTEFPEITNYKSTVMDINFLGLLSNG